MDGSDVLSLKSSVTKEEQPMFEMIEANLSNDKYSRSEIELLLAEAEDNGIFNGRIGVLVRWSGYDVDTFIRYWKNSRSFGFLTKAWTHFAEHYLQKTGKLSNHEKRLRQSLEHVQSGRQLVSTHNFRIRAHKGIP